MKYFALTGLLVLVLVLALGMRLAMQPPQASIQDSQTPMTQPSAIKGDPAAVTRDILQVRHLDSNLEAIEARAFEARNDTALIAFSRTAPTDASLLARLRDADDQSEPRQSRVSLLYSGLNFNRAVVDGKYVRRGDRLPGGGRVLRISENSVLVRTDGRRHLLHVPSSRQITKNGH